MSYGSRLRQVGVGVAIALVLAAAAIGTAQEPVRYFDESGHNVSGAFLEFFDANGGIAIFGYPITEAFEDDAGQIVQYFQRARFEWDAAAETVRLGDLGLELRAPDPPQPPEAFSAAERYFPETGHAIGWEFRAFYEANGDRAIFGLPITDLLIEDDVVVQYFERARFEWRYPETPARPVRLTQIGSFVFAQSGLDPRLRQPGQLPPGRVRRVTALDGQASVARPVLAPGEAQTVYVRVADQVGEPVSDASVRVEGVAEGRTLFALAVPAAGARGTYQLTLEAIDAAPGTRVVLRVTAERDGLTATTETSFRVWW